MQGNQCCVFLFVARLAYIGFALVQSGMQVLCIVQQTTNGLFVTTGPFECRKIMSAPLKALYNRTQQTASAAVSLPSITESVAFVCIVMVTEQACACSASLWCMAWTFINFTTVPSVSIKHAKAGLSNTTPAVAHTAVP